MKRIFANATPETAGVATKSIMDLLSRLESKNLAIHSFLLLRNETVLTETYYEPYTADTPHRMFSASKSLVSLAIGYLQDCGKLNINDNILPYFPEYAPQKPHPYIANLTIRDLLLMAGPHAVPSYKQEPDGDWIGSFFSVPPDHLGGMCFNYDTSATHVLTALVERLSKKKLADFLKNEVFAPLHLLKETCCIPDPQGVSQGGRGLMLAPYDLLKIMHVLLNGGLYKNQQLISVDYVRQATRAHFPVVVETAPMVSEHMTGYGYQFWTVLNGGFAVYGMGGQIGVCFPEKKLVFVLTADFQGKNCGLGMVLDHFFDCIFNNLSDTPLDECKKNETQDFNDFLKNRKLPVLFCQQKKIHYSLKRTYAIDTNVMNIEKAEIHIVEEYGFLKYFIEEQEFCLKFGIGKNILAKFPQTDFTCAGSACWFDEKTFMIKIQLVDKCLGNLMLQCLFNGENLVFGMKKNEETFLKGFEGFLTGKLIQLED